MQVSIWNDYLKKLDSRMRVQNRNILLLIDNAPTHALYENTNLTNIVIEHLPQIPHPTFNPAIRESSIVLK